MRDFVLISSESFVADSSLCSAVGVFAAPQNPSTDKEPSTLRARQAQAHCVPQLRRFRARSERRGRVLLCRVAFGSYCGSSYCGTDLVSRADRSRARAPACCARVHPRAAAVVADDKIFENGEVARRVSRLGSNPSLTSPLLRIGDPSPYATRGGPSVDPTVLQVLRSYPLTRATRYLVPVTEHVSEPPALHIIADSFFLSMVFGGPFCPENNRHGFYKNTLLLKLLHAPSVLRRSPALQATASPTDSKKKD